MKPSLLLSAFFFIAIPSSPAKAQFEDPQQEEAVYEIPNAETPKWVSDKGYWVIKTNKNAPKESTVYFYNNEHALVYQEEIKNQKLKLNKKTLMKLKAALEEAVGNYEKGSWASNKEIVLQHLQR